MLITYRRTGGVLALVAFAAVAIAAAVFTVAVGAVLLLAAVTLAVVALAARAVLPAWWRRRPEPTATPWPHETIEGTVVDRPAVSNSLESPR